MKRSGYLALAAGALALAALTGAPDARADGVVQSGQFCTAVAAGHCTDDAAALSHGHVGIYFINLDNRGGAEVHITVVWRLDGRVVNRQNITTRGRATWSMQPLRNAAAVSVTVLDASGAQLNTGEATVTH